MVFRRQTKTFLVVASILTSILFIMENTAFSQEDEYMAKIEGAKKEGNLVLGSASNMIAVKTMIDAFERKYPFIKVGYAKNTSEALLNRIVTEYTNKKYTYDIVDFNVLMMNVLKGRGILSKYLSPQEIEQYKLGEFGIFSVTVYGQKSCCEPNSGCC